MNIRTLTVEFLRAGPRHNQLVSPLTPYLTICGDSAAEVIKLPWEHRELELLLAELSYSIPGPNGADRRKYLLSRLGQHMADILTQINGISGGLSLDNEHPDTLTQLRIVISASELAMLPFEVSKVPSGGASDVWLGVQTQTPVCITRHIRSVSAERMRWPKNPRILFVAGPDTPVDEHRNALVCALAPWADAETDQLVCLEEGRIADIMRVVETAALSGRPFSHVHILAHGVPFDATDRYSPVGIKLFDEVVSGERLASALTGVVGDTGTFRPVVVTLATCDSAKITDVRAPDASVAHDLHYYGIPLVIASQFPLSVAGSIPLVARFYERQLWGEHPLLSLHDVRRDLHGRTGPQIHDWASLVVYEALPSNLPAQLEEVRYWQTRRAHDRTLVQLEKFARRDGGEKAVPVAEVAYDGLKKRVIEVSARLPNCGAYALECAGLRVAGQKRMAQVAFQLAVQLAVPPEAPDPWRTKLFSECARLLDESRAGYWSATQAYLGSTSQPTQQKANLHWLLGQVLSLDAVLGRSLDQLSWNAARFAAQVDIESMNKGQRAWGHTSMAELTLLKLNEVDVTPTDRERFADEAAWHATRVVELVGRSSEQATSTGRQIDRYASWWGNPAYAWAFPLLRLPDRAHWHVEHGLVPTAQRIVAILGSTQPPPV